AVAVADREEARSRLVRGQMEALGPVTVAALADRVCLTGQDVEYGIRSLEAAGFVLRGRFTPGLETDEFCDRRLLARVHRYTLDQPRQLAVGLSPPGKHLWPSPCGLNYPCCCSPSAARARCSLPAPARPPRFTSSCPPAAPPSSTRSSTRPAA